MMLEKLIERGRERARRLSRECFAMLYEETQPDFGDDEDEVYDSTAGGRITLALSRASHCPACGRGFAAVGPQPAVASNVVCIACRKPCS